MVGLASKTETHSSTSTATTDYSHQITHGTYYPHIDGIRALAVVPVVLFHLLASLCPGGFAGVDVFFVISGYLIVGGVLRDLGKGQFTISSFYHRRIRRILPAYFTLIAIVFAVGCAVLYALPLMYLGDTAVMGTLFSANIYFFIFGGNYFDPDLHNNALLHLWSLSVEEQFYLFIPLLCAIVWKFRRRSIVPALGFLFVVSLAAAVYAVGTGKATNAFYLLHYRAWELLAGALLATMPVPSQAETPQAAKRFDYRPLLALAGLLLVLIPYAFLSSATPFPGAAALPSVLGTVLLIRFGQFGWVNKLLTWRLFIWFGLISYSLYLWHWPVINFWKYVAYDQLSAWDYIGIFALSIVLSWLSWKFVERPVRVAKSWAPRHSFAFAAAGIVLLVSLGAACILGKGWPGVLHPEANKLSAITEFPSRVVRLLVYVEKQAGAVTGHKVDDSFRLWFGAPGDYRLGKHDQPTLLLIGDSKAGALQHGLNVLLRENGYSGYAINRSSTNLFDMRTPDCRYVLAELAKKPSVTSVIVAQNWGEYAEKAQMEQLEKFAERVISMRKTLYILTDIPNRAHPPTEMAARTRIIPPRHMEAGWDDGRLSESAFLQRQGADIRQLETVCRNTGAVLVPLHLALKQGEYYIAFENGCPLYRDKSHLSRDGSLRAARFILPYLSPRQHANGQSAQNP